MVDFAVLPPEVTSARMYSGSGSGPLVAAATAWDQLAATLGSAAGSYRSVVLELTDESWQGPASTAMAAAANPYVEWMNATAAQATATANQVRAAAAAFEAAHAAVVPPPVIAANRAALSSLVTSNVLGQNSAAIAANQAEYGQMWAQDAAAMQAYAVGSKAATKPLPAFSPPPQTANPAAAGTAAGGQPGAAQGSLTDFLGNLPDISAPLRAFLDNNTFNGLNAVFGSFGNMALQSSGPMFFSEMCQFFELPLMTATGKLSIMGPIAAANALGTATSAGLASSVSAEGSGLALAGSYESANGAAASAAAGRAVPLGQLSVPPSWSAAAPEIRLAATSLPAAGASVLSPGGLGMTTGGFGGVPMVAGMVNAPRGGDTRVRSGAGVETARQRGVASDGDQDAQNGFVSEPGADGQDDREIDRLRDQMGDLAMECKAMARLMREAMR